MPSRPAALGDLERAVMDVLWGAEPGITVREVHEALASRELAYTTVMTVLDRLAKKGLTERERDGRLWRYSAAASREALAATVMRQSFETLDTTGRRAALLHFLDDADPGEIADLRAALAEVERRHAGDRPATG